MAVSLSTSSILYVSSYYFFLEMEQSKKIMLMWYLYLSKENHCNQRCFSQLGLIQIKQQSLYVQRHCSAQPYKDLLAVGSVRTFVVPAVPYIDIATFQSTVPYHLSLSSMHQRLAIDADLVVAHDHRHLQ